MNRRDFIRNTLLIGAAGPFSNQDAWGLSAIPGEPYNPIEFQRTRITDTWTKYDGVLTWGKGQCLAILDDGCKLAIPEWQVSLPWGKKVVAGFDSVDNDDDPSPVPPGYHGTAVGFPSSLQHEGRLGVAFNNHVAHVRAVSVAHLKTLEAKSLAGAARWVIANHERLHITAVNLSPADDQRHNQAVPTEFDGPLAELRKAGIWVSGPCGNHGFPDGISWPACQPGCFAIGATKPDEDVVHLDRCRKTALVVPARATTTSNAIAVGAAMILREAIERSRYDWKTDGATLPEAMMAIFQRTGVRVSDSANGLSFSRLDAFAAVRAVWPQPA